MRPSGVQIELGSSTINESRKLESAGTQKIDLVSPLVVAKSQNSIDGSHQGIENKLSTQKRRKSSIIESDGDHEALVTELIAPVKEKSEESMERFSYHLPLQSENRNVIFDTMGKSTNRLDTKQASVLEEEGDKVKPFDSLDVQKLSRQNSKIVQETKDQQEIAKRIEMMKRKLQETVSVAAKNSVLNQNKGALSVSNIKLQPR